MTQERRNYDTELRELREDFNDLQEDFQELREKIDAIIDVVIALSGLLTVLVWVGKAFKWATVIATPIALVLTYWNHKG